MEPNAPPPAGPPGGAPPPGWQPYPQAYPQPYPRPPQPPRGGSGATVAIVLGCVVGGIVILGILAAVAIPAFMKSSRKAKSPEAVVNLKRIYEGARLYYEDYPSTELPRFPPTPAIPTQPALGTCCGSGTTKCAPDPSLWLDPSWQALKFSMDHPHYFSYTYESAGSGASAVFSARANGDLDCDAVYSTFELLGSVGFDGTVTGYTGMFRDQELE